MVECISQSIFVILLHHFKIKLKSSSFSVENVEKRQFIDMYKRLILFK